jgi:hypothetical protein
LDRWRLDALIPAPDARRSTPAPREPASGDRPDPEAGLATATGMLLAFFMLTFAFMLTLSMSVYLYGRAQLRSAVNEGVRYGQPFGRDTADCEARIAGLESGLGMFNGLTYSCDVDNDLMTATATGDFSVWFFGTPTLTVTESAHALKDHGR